MVTGTNVSTSYVFVASKYGSIVLSSNRSRMSNMSLPLVHYLSQYRFYVTLALVKVSILRYYRTRYCSATWALMRGSCKELSFGYTRYSCVPRSIPGPAQAKRKNKLKKEKKRPVTLVSSFSLINTTIKTVFRPLCLGQACC